jgi:hypothetical protein
VTKPRTVSPDNALQTIFLWLEAINAKDCVRALALSDVSIEVGGPRGSGYGHELVREWLDRAGIHLETLRVFQRDEVAVIEQRATWDSPSGERIGVRSIGTLFQIRGEKVVRAIRYDSLDDALRAARLGADDEIES